MLDHSFILKTAKPQRKSLDLAVSIKSEEFLDQHINKHLADYNQEISKDTDHTPVNF
jgi:hypothetical protein